MKPVVKIGRDKSNDIEINEPRISRYHAIITDLGDGSFEIKDLGSSNGTFVNGVQITQQIITSVDKVEVATCMVNWYPSFSELNAAKQALNIQEEPFAKIRKTISIGSSIGSDIVLPEDFVSNHHANISLLKNGDYFIEDLKSSNGTYVNSVEVSGKNFTKTDLVKIATADLPQNWFLHKNLQPNLFKDHKKAWLISFSLFIILAASVLMYFNRCKWFNYGCNLSAQQIYLKNKNSIVHIVHDYYYTIEDAGKTYFVGKNKLFNVTEANTSKENLLPYNSTSGNGCFISKDGIILTSTFIVNPWLNDLEKISMLKEVKASKTIEKFSLQKDYDICGETSGLKWLSDGLVNNEQNYIAATSVKSCNLTDSSSSTIQSIKKVLPENVEIVNCAFDPKSENYLNKTSGYYYSKATLLSPNSILRDTFYLAPDTFDINKLKTVSINKELPELPEGSIVLNERGELIGIIQQHKVVFIHRFYKQIHN
jgi:pSer/pThr/pTyr-binding forkhead associated (FHA) protein